MLMNPTPTPSYPLTGTSVLFSHPCQHSAGQIHRLMIPLFIVLAGFLLLSIPPPKKNKKNSSISRLVDGFKIHYLPPLMTLMSW